MSDQDVIDCYHNDIYEWVVYRESDCNRRKIVVEPQGWMELRRRPQQWQVEQ
jgi:hypothetical protein